MRISSHFFIIKEAEGSSLVVIMRSLLGGRWSLNLNPDAADNEFEFIDLQITGFTDHVRISSRCLARTIPQPCDGDARCQEGCK
jgi:hypothetical protein